jgi:hypothetical protein
MQDQRSLALDTMGVVRVGAKGRPWVKNFIEMRWPFRMQAVPGILEHFGGDLSLY